MNYISYLFIHSLLYVYILLRNVDNIFAFVYIRKKDINFILHFASLEHNLFRASDNAIFHVISCIYPIFTISHDKA